MSIIDSNSRWADEDKAMALEMAKNPDLDEEGVIWGSSKRSIDWASRIAKATKAINASKVTRLTNDLYQVVGNGGTYKVYASRAGASCDCKWGKHTPFGWSNPCYHMLAAAGFADVDVPLTDPDPTPTEDPDSDPFEGLAEPALFAYHEDTGFWSDGAKSWKLVGEGPRGIRRGWIRKEGERTYAWRAWVENPDDETSILKSDQGSSPTFASALHHASNFVKWFEAGNYD